MKKLYALLTAGLLLAAPFAADAMDAATLAEHPAQYRTLFANGRETVYIDMSTLKSQQTLDFPGSLENVQATLYAETYKEKADPMDFAKGKLVTRIREYEVSLFADKRVGKFELEKSLVACYDADGKEAKLPADAKAAELAATGRDLYLNLYLIERNQK